MFWAFSQVCEVVEQNWAWRLMQYEAFWDALSITCLHDQSEILNNTNQKQVKGKYANTKSRS